MKPQMRDLANLLVKARLSRSRCDPLPKDLIPQTEADGYDVQEEAQAQLVRQLDTRICGYKLGFVTSSMREAWGGVSELGIDQPIYGCVLSKGTYLNSVELPCSDFFSPYIEGEFAVRMEHDVPSAGVSADEHNIREFVGACMAGIEVVDLRTDFRLYQPPTAPVVIADSGGNAGCVLGPEIRNWRDLNIPELRGILKVDGKVAAEGHARDLDGDPFKVLAWLANAMRSRGKQLRRGDIVLLGSVTPSYGKIQAGERLSFAWDGLSEASVTFHDHARSPQ